MKGKEVEAPQPVEAQEIRITGKGEGLISVKNLTPFQGRFKELTEKNAWKLRQQIRELGFCSPVVIWKAEGKNYIIDGHERVQVVQDMLEKGEIKLDEVSKARKEGLMVPYCECFPKDTKEAKQMLLALTASFGTVSSKGVKKFLGGTKYHEEDLQVVFNFPDLLPAKSDEEGEKKEKKAKEKDGEGGDVDEGKRMKNVTCPACGHKFRTPA
jgi:adenine-specific DNA methylase